MFYLLGMFVVTIIVGTLLIRAALLVMGRRAGKFLHETHRDLECIHTTGRVPPQWTEPFRKNVQTLRGDDPHDQSLLAKNAKSARKTCLKKLAKLHTYVERSSLVENEETRDILLQKLANVRTAWQEQDWSSIIAP